MLAFSIIWAHGSTRKSGFWYSRNAARGVQGMLHAAPRARDVLPIQTQDLNPGINHVM